MEVRQTASMTHHITKKKDPIKNIWEQTELIHTSILRSIKEDQ